MKAIQLMQPGQISFGNGCANESVAWLAARQAKRVTVITSSAVLPSLSEFLRALEKQCDLQLYARVDQEPTVAMFEEALAYVRNHNPDAIVGIGGGSAMDVAKLVAALADERQKIRDVFGINVLSHRALKLLCLPTTAGTGSEVSPNAVLLDERENLKKGVISPALLPDAAFVDPLLTVSVPPAVTAATGMDALVHCIEAYANKFAHPMVDLYALEGIRRIGDSLARAVHNGKDLEARSDVALGSLYGGLCLGPVNTAAVHALAYPLGSEFHVAHGVSNAILLAHVLRFNLPAAVDRYAAIATALGVNAAGTPESTAAAGIERLAALAREVKIPQKMCELGVPPDAIPRMAKAAMTITRLLKNNPREMTEAAARDIYLAAA